VEIYNNREPITGNYVVERWNMLWSKYMCKRRGYVLVSGEYCIWKIVKSGNINRS